MPKTKENPKGFAIRAIVLRNGKAKLLAFPGVVLPKVRPFYVEADWCKPYGAASASGGAASAESAAGIAADASAVAATAQAPAAQGVANNGNVVVAAASVVPGPPSVEAAPAASVKTVVTVTEADAEYQAMF